MTDSHSQPRDGRGKFARDLAMAERDRKAAELVTRGHTYQEAADACGFSNKGDCWRAVRKVRAETAMLSGGSEDLRQAELASLAEQQRLLWDRIQHPIPAFSRTGKPLLDPDGHPVPDQQALANTHALLVRVGQRIAAIRGYDAPRRSITMTGQLGARELFAIIRDANPQDVTTAVAMYRQYVEEETARNALPGTLEP